MANTTVARLYHSEAILLLDGRVLASGSDPQDDVNPQEYRVEVFTPSYLLTGRPRPVFSLNDTEWDYGASITMMLGMNEGKGSWNSTLGVSGNGTNWNSTLSRGNATMGMNHSGWKVSLVGSVASTHGNAMGQRTIFPEFKCMGGGKCVVIPPPNAHVAPPGWYMFFFLINGTPSKGVFVRIGGDPAELGNWPDADGFDVPGV